MQTYFISGTHSYFMDAYDFGKSNKLRIGFIRSSFVCVLIPWHIGAAFSILYLVPFIWNVILVGFDFEVRVRIM